METSTVSSVNMDNISLKGIHQINHISQNQISSWFSIDYCNPAPCPGSPTSPDKLLSSTSTTTTLSPPGAVPLAASATSLASSGGKRRVLGLNAGHRASYKRAHMGRLVSHRKRILCEKD
jgi:hypothetical protein